MAHIITINNPLTGQPQQVIRSDYPAQRIDDVVAAMLSALPGGAGLPVSQGGTGANTPQKALVNLGARPNRNLLDNAYFVGGGTAGNFPINQLGQTSYTSQQNTPTCISRWRLEWNASVTLQEDHISCTGMYQNLPHLASDQIVGKEVTISVLRTDGFRTETVTVAEGANTPSTIGISIVYNFGGYDGYSVRVRAGNFKAIKLELGDKQTLAYEDGAGAWELLEVPDYAEVNARCQQYLLVETAENEKPGTVYSTTSGTFTISPAVQMRTTPVLLDLTGYEPKIALANGSTVPITKDEITVLGSDAAGIRFRVDVSAGKSLTLGTATVRDCNLSLSAEL